MGIALSTVGIKVSYAVETTAGTRPTTGYTHIPDLKSIPSFNPSPNTADATTFDNKEFTTSVLLLKDLGGALPFRANLTQELLNVWETMVDAYEVAIKLSRKTWFCVDIPGIDKAVYLPVQPARMGIPELETNALNETEVYVTPLGEPEFADDPTYSEQSLLNNDT